MEEIYLHEPRTDVISTDGNIDSDFIAVMLLMFLLLAKGEKNQPAVPD